MVVYVGFRFFDSKQDSRFRNSIGLNLGNLFRDDSWLNLGSLFRNDHGLNLGRLQG